MLAKEELASGNLFITNYGIGNGHVTKIGVHIRDCVSAIQSISRTQIGTDFTLDKLIDSSGSKLMENQSVGRILSNSKVSITSPSL